LTNIQVLYTGATSDERILPGAQQLPLFHGASAQARSGFRRPAGRIARGCLL